MKRIKSIGLAIAMALALTAMLGAASASAAQFRAEEYPTSVTGTQGVKQKLTTTFSNKNPQYPINCTTATGTATVSEPSFTLTLTPSFSGCQAYNAVATVNTHGCKYVFHNNTNTYENNGTMDISCPKESDSIEFEGGGCTTKYLPQTARGNVNFSNMGGDSRNHKITVTYEVTGLTYTVSGLFCIDGQGTRSDGTYTGTEVLKGYNNAAGHAVGLVLFNEQYTFPTIFEAEENSISVEATQLEGFFFSGFGSGAEARCSIAHSVTNFNTSPGEPAKEIGLGVDKWSECSTFYIGEIAMNGCTLQLHPLTSEELIADGTFGIACPAGKSMIINSLGCKISVGAQSGLGAVHFQGSGSGASRALTASINVTNLKFTEPAGCSHPGTHETLRLSGSVNIKGFYHNGTGELGPQRGLWIN